MFKKLSGLIYGATNKYTVTGITAIFCIYVFWILPNSTDVDRIIGTGAALIVPFFKYLLYTPGDFYGQLDAYEEAGRQAFIDYRLVNATLWLLTLGGFLTIITSACLRLFVPLDSWHRQLNLVALLPSLFDFLENKLQIILVLLYPQRFDELAVLAASFTAVKWITLLAAFLILFYALIRGLVSSIGGRG
jgi:hypothetical protein